MQGKKRKLKIMVGMTIYSIFSVKTQAPTNSIANRCNAYQVWSDEYFQVIFSHMTFSACWVSPTVDYKQQQVAASTLSAGFSN